MIRTQIQLPDDLYRRAKRFGAAREMSLAEMTRRGLELLLDRAAPGPLTLLQPMRTVAPVGKLSSVTFPASVAPAGNVIV